MAVANDQDTGLAWESRVLGTLDQGLVKVLLKNRRSSCATAYPNSATLICQEGLGGLLSHAHG
jgi:hypothetical protein